ncbi:Tetratricopeptide repeat protein [Rhynchospora pubera]|uniref:Tetratricopeptide repeat protein n=2 Tax=Rhynchospora pubera TaxID=906938 RepID=A0AAV8HIS4_9POAL|nr:Tetratricopeptide repeat protein [Rhynchospora pubera]
MALWMEAGSDPVTDKEKADLDAIAALKQSSALDLKEQGNQFVKKGKKHYSDAIESYTRAINQKALDDSETSVLFANRAHVNLLLGNYRRALTDAEEAIKLCPSNIKAYYRAAKASFCLNLYSEAISFCERGLEQSPSNEDIRKILTQVNSVKTEQELREAKAQQALSTAKGLLSAIEKRGLRFGKALYQDLTGLRKPTIDNSGIFHWPVLLLYAEAMSSDFIEDFAETDTFSSHLDVMFSESAMTLPWDSEHAYTREALELYYQAGAGTILSKKGALKYFLEGILDSSALSSVLSEETDKEHHACDGSRPSEGKDHGKWIKVNERKTLLEVLQQKEYIISAIPVFFVVSKKSSFYKEFKSGQWSPP